MLKRYRFWLWTAVVVLLLNALFGICFAVMVAFTFLPPIVLTGVIFLSLLLTYFLIPRQPQVNCNSGVIGDLLWQRQK
jgi:ribose/xylose/arabinose/galactoside ABC-type transport system permease subunit